MDISGFKSLAIGAALLAVGMLIGLIFFGIVVDQAATTGSDAQITSFTGVRAVNDLVPLGVIAGLAVGAILGGVALFKAQS